MSTTSVSQKIQSRQKLRGGAIVLGIIGFIALLRGTRSSSQTNPPTKEERRIAMETVACTTSLVGTTRYAGYGCYEYCNGKQREKKSGCSDSPDNSQYKSNQPCIGLPANTQRNGEDAIDQIWDGSKRYPTTTGRYNEEVSNGECTFKCESGYKWENNTCIPTCTPGVMYNTGMETITITDCTTSYTIMDKNLGATQVGTGTDSYGYYFQRGNNYGFSNTETISSISSDQVDASNYGPTNPYFSGTFILTGQRDSSDNRNLRGGDGDVEANGRDTKNARTDRQGPCSDGYHVPSIGEWGGLIALRHNANANHGGTYYVMDELPFISSWSTSDLMKFQADTKLPLAGYRYHSSASFNGSKGNIGYYWSSSPYPYAGYVRRFHFDTLGMSSIDSSNSGYGFVVRCFKNT